jgi:hypothetical protein
MTTGVAIPSFRPLSTVINRRVLDGTAGSLTTGVPSAASVGARAAPTRRASQVPSPGRCQAASAQPASTVSGRPMPSNRA